MARNTRQKRRRRVRLSLDLLHDTDKKVWAVLKDMRQRGELGISQPRAAAINAAIERLGWEPLSVKVISQSLKRLEDKGWIRRPLELVAA